MMKYEANHMLNMYFSPNKPNITEKKMRQLIMGADECFCIIIGSGSNTEKSTRFQGKLLLNFHVNEKCLHLCE